MENTESVKIHIIKDGPIHVSGKFVFKDSSGNVTEKHEELYICRCGGSENKPFCDGTHKKIGVKN